MDKYTKTLKFFAYITFILLIFASAIKIHSKLSKPKIHNWNYFQLKKIDKSAEKFSFAVFGDNKNSAKTFDNLIQKVNKENILFSIDIGDLVYDGDVNKFKFFIKQIEKLNKPFLTVIGNHEIKDNGRGNYYELFGKFYYSFVIGDCYFITLDTANEKNLGEEQYEWLKSELQKSQKYKYRFVLMHVPLFDPRKGTEKRGHSLEDINFAKKLNNLFDEENVTMVFASHIHGYYKGNWNKTPFIITGGAGAELMGTNKEHYFYHYLIIKISEDGIEYQVKKLKSPDFEFFDRLTHDVWLYVYAFLAIHFIDSILIIGFIYLFIYIIFLKEKWLILNVKKNR